MAEGISVSLLDSMGSDRSIAESAWVSTGIQGDSRSSEQVASLVRRLAEDGHGVPFESVIFRFYIQCPRYIETQIVKHRIASVNGLSARYREITTDYLPLPEDAKNLLDEEEIERFTEICDAAQLWYARNICKVKHAKKLGLASVEDLKRAKETFRGILPQAQLTHLNMTINLRSLANFIRLRAHPSAQKEVQLIAQLMANHISGVCPVAFDSLRNQDWRI